MEEKLGIEELKKELTRLCNVAAVVEKAISLSGGPLSKLSLLIAIGDDLLGMVTAPYPKILQELKDLDAVERQEVLSHVASKLDLQHDAVEKAIEGGLVVAVKVAEVVAELIGFAKGLKPVQA